MEKNHVRETIHIDELYKLFERWHGYPERWLFSETYGSESEREEVETKYGEECEVMTWNETFDSYKKIAERELKEGRESPVFGYIDFSKMVVDDVENRHLDLSVLGNGNVYFVRL